MTSTLINGTSLGNIIIVIGSFPLLLVLIKVFAWGQLTGIFKTREKRILNNTDGAEAVREEAEALAAKHQEELVDVRIEAIQIIDDTEETGKDREAKIVAGTCEEASRLKTKINQDIEQSKTGALLSVKSDVADLTILLAEKITTTNLNGEARSNLIDSCLGKLGDA